MNLPSGVREWCSPKCCTTAHSSCVNTGVVLCVSSTSQKHWRTSTASDTTEWQDATSKLVDFSVGLVWEPPPSTHPNSISKGRP